MTAARRVAGAVLVLLLGVPAAAAAQAVGVQQLAAEAPALLAELAALRGLPEPGPPPRVVIRTREERRRFILREFRRKYSTGRLDAERRAMVAWGLIPRDFDLAGFLTDLVLEQATAYYDPVGKGLVLANWLGREAQQDALAHELVHLLQDRQVGLDRFLTVPPGRGDEALARQAIVEGEAVALTLDRDLHRRGEDLGRLPDVARLQHAFAVSGTGPVLGRAPRFLRALLTFPYAAGLGFVHRFRQRQPWAAFSRVYADPPRSTHEILHPARYLDGPAPPVALALPDLGPAIPGGRRVLDDVAGEFGLGAILEAGLGTGAAAEGWRGDRYALWEDAGGGAIVVALSTWADETAAGEFADAYRRLLVAKHRLSPADGPAWTVGARAYGVERRGATVLLYEGVPVGALPAARAALAPPPG